MAIVSCDLLTPNFVSLITSGFFGGPTFTAGGKYGFVFQAPKTGTIDRVLWGTGTASGSPTVEVRLETVSTGSPSGTLLGTNTSVTTGVVASNTSYESTLTSGASVTKGDYLSLVFAYASGTSIQIGESSQTSWSQLNLSQTSTGGSYSLRSGRIPYAALRYSDGTYVGINAGGVAFGVGNQSGFYTSGEKGLRFRLPYTARITGFWNSNDPDSDQTVNLYADATAPGGSAILSTSIGSANFIQKNPVISIFRFASTATLSANTWYRLVTSINSSPGVRYNFTTVTTASHASAIAADWMFTESSGSSWVNTDTTLPHAGPVLDGFDDGAGGGGGGLILPRPMNGGYSA